MLLLEWARSARIQNEMVVFKYELFSGSLVIPGIAVLPFWLEVVNFYILSEALLPPSLCKLLTGDNDHSPCFACG